MTYVDEAIHQFRRMVMCHMTADSLAELHAMADRIGIARRWFQDKPGGTPHYDICKTKRALAVAAGAVEVDRYEQVRVIRYWRDYMAGPPRPAYCQRAAVPRLDLFA